MTKVKFPIQYNGGSIYERKDGGGYRAVLHVGGVQHSKTSRHLPLLKAWIDRNSGIVREGKTPLTNTENVEYRKAIAELPEGVTLLDAVRGFKDGLAKNQAMMLGKKFVEGAELFLSDCRTKRVRKPTYDNYEQYLKRVGKAWGNVSIPSITTEDVRELLALDETKADTTRNQYHKLLTIFFNFAMKQKWISDNPVSPVARAKIVRRRPAIYSPEQVMVIMHAAQRVAPAAIPYFALMFFAGMRPDTIPRYEWEYISATKVFVPLELNKTPIDYEIPIRPNLAAWLALTPPECRQGKICVSSGGRSWRQQIETVRKASSVRFIQDGGRRTFASSVCALDGVEKAVEQMGHQSPSMLYRHYRTLINKERAKAFFEIFPMRDPAESTTSSTSAGSAPNHAKSLPEPCQKIGHLGGLEDPEDA